jgi:hypothetical protein
MFIYTLTDVNANVREFHGKDRAAAVERAWQAGFQVNETIAGESRPMNVAKFLVWEDGKWVLVILTDASPVTTFEGGGPTEEGYNHWSTTYTLDGTDVVRESNSSGSDCDGRMDTSRTDVCPVANLESSEHEDYETGVSLKLPTWVKQSASQRDHSAEAMGY